MECISCLATVQEKNTVREILSTHVPHEKLDLFHWTGIAGEKCSNKSVYAYVVWERDANGGSHSGTRLWKKLWHSLLIPKWKIFIWKLIHKSLPLRKRLKRRGIQVEVSCPICHTYEETEGNIFRYCWLVDHVWKTCSVGIVVKSASQINFKD